ncbi:MAG: UvrD-helicase domain-containing protein [Bacteroidales bacterium]|nr:UvrD-helicase domain-containing protein [Bacteroidales bacterium]
MSDKILDQLNEAQRDAAACTDGPVMIIAGAGSGKTRTLTYRIAHLVDQGVDPFNIMALTFTNKAAEEMKSRITSLVGPEAKNLWMGTFHSIFCKVLRIEAEKLGYIRTFSIYDTDDTKSAIKQIVKQLQLDPKVYSPTYVANRISMAKSSLMGPEDYLNNPEIQQTDADAHKPQIGTIYKMYNQRLRNAMAMDFDDLLFNMNILLRDFPDVLLKYQNRLRYIMVDEYQDTNYAQYLIVKKLAARYQNICVVGDDAQSIYAFRGANIQNIFNFRRDYPNLHLFKLEQNYRSTQNIVNAANSIIANNKEQIEKTIWTDNGVGNPIKLLCADDERHEADLVANGILDARIGDNMEYSDFAVLYRTNSQSRAIEEALRKLSIPYRIYAGISFYGRKEIKNVLAYLRLVVNNYDDESLMRIINLPPRGIGQTTMERIQLAAADNDVSIWTVLENIAGFGLGIGDAIQKKIAQFTTMIKVFTSQVPTSDAFELAKQIVYASGLLAMLRDDDDPDNANRIENIEELLNGIKEFCDKEDLITPGADELLDENGTAPTVKTLDQFLQQVLLLTSEDKDDDNDTNKVSLMSIHAAKGLEFPFVYVTGMEENIFPSFMSLSTRQELEEERRLFYVALTRAEKQVVLTYAMQRYQYGKASSQELSRFVEEIDDQYIERPRRKSLFPKIGELPKSNLPGRESGAQANGLRKPTLDRSKLKKLTPGVKGPTQPRDPELTARIIPGIRVLHATFGVGKVLSVFDEGADRKARIFFENAGEKVMMLCYAKLTVID